MGDEKGMSDKPMDSIGQRLASARRTQGKSLEDVEQATKIRPRYIEALEHDQFAVIPGDVYVRSFLKTYANYLGLDAGALLNQYREGEVVSLRANAKLAPTITVRRKRSPRWLRAGLILILVVAAAIALLSWGGRIAKRPIERYSDEATSVTTPATSPPEGSAPRSETPREVPQGVEEGTTVTTPPSRGITTIKATATDERGCWVKVVVDDKLAYEGVLEQNEAKEWSGATVFIRAGNAKGLLIERDGEPLGPLGLSGGIAEKTFSASEGSTER